MTQETHPWELPKVSIKELIQEINYGHGAIQSSLYRERLTQAILRYARFVEEKKAAKPKKIRTTKAPNLLSLSQWEAQVGGQLSIGMLTGWTNAKRLDSKEVAQLIEEFRTEMVSKNKLYADFKAAFQTYLTKGYLSKTLAQVAWKAPEGANRTFTRGVSI